MRSIAVFALTGALLAAGCVSSDATENDASDTDVPATDGSYLDLLRPVDDPWYDVSYGGTYAQRGIEFASGPAPQQQFHTYAEVLDRIDAWANDHPDLVHVETLAETHEGRPIQRVTLSAGDKPVAMFDGGHHGNEYAGAEVMIYLVDLLLANQDHPVVADWLKSLEIQVVPVVNPDGWEAGTRYNARGVNLNRNYDVDWGNPLGTSNPVMGPVVGTTGQSFGGIALVAENCGPSPFSEPESMAIRDWMAGIGDRAAFYLTGHTPANSVVPPWAAFDGPHEIPAEHYAVFDATLDWINANTQYEGGYAEWGRFDGGLPYAFSGSSMDWFYLTYGKPTFTVEVEWMGIAAGSDDFPLRTIDEFDSLAYWMAETIPIHLHLLANAENLRTWQVPTAPVPAVGGDRPWFDWSILPDDTHVH